MLFLFSDVGTDDAPTRIRVGSHLDVPAVLAPFGEGGMSTIELSEALGSSATRPLALATGQAGDVYLCHPFLVHAAQEYRGTSPRFIAQPPLGRTPSCNFERPDGAYSPVGQAVRLGLGRD